MSNSIALEILKIIAASEDVFLKSPPPDNLKKLMLEMSKDELVESIFTLTKRFTLAINASTEHFKLLAIELGMHPHEVDNLNMPTLIGSLFGAGLHNVCGTKVCDTCAFKQGSAANQCSPTIADLLDCLESGEPFYCHEGLSLDCEIIAEQGGDEFSPKHICFGFLQAMKGGA